MSQPYVLNDVVVRIQNVHGLTTRGLTAHTDIGVARIDHERVLSSAPHELVGTKPTRQRIVTGTTLKGIVPITTSQGIGTRRACEVILQPRSEVTGNKTAVELDIQILRATKVDLQGSELSQDIVRGRR